MLPTTLLLSALTALPLASAHFHINYPLWRADSLGTNKSISQWFYPCAGVGETTDPNNRTAWSPQGGSIKLQVSHEWALTYVNLGIGTNVSSFNISLVDNFNQTGNGTFCLKQAGKEALSRGLASAALTAESANGMSASLQVIQISHTGAALYNCADITFNTSAALLSDEECKNSTNVGGVAIANVGSGSPTANATTPTPKAGAAGTISPALGMVGVMVMGAAVLGL